MRDCPGSKEDDDDQKSVRGWRHDKKMYTKDEDLKIIKYLLENKRFGDVKGNSMWEVNQILILFISFLFV